MIPICFVFMGLGSALISGVTGLAGGVLLLSALSLYYPIEVVIPIHALVQVLANLSRVIILRDHIEWPIWRSFNLLSIPAGILGAYSISYLPTSFIKFAVGLVILLAAISTLNPKLTSRQTSPDIHTTSSWRYVLLGTISSFLGMVVGATGPLIAPFFMIAGLKKERFIATKSACQLTIQVIKTALFIQMLNFAYQDYSMALSLIIMGVFAGTWLAKKMLSKLNGAWLDHLIALMLIILSLRMMYSAI